MADKTTQDGRLLRITTPLEADYLLLESFSVTEGLSRLYAIDAVLVHEEDDPGSRPTIIDPKKLIGQSATIGLIFGIPLLLAGLILPLIMMRDLFQRNEVDGACPYCSAPIKTSDATIRLNCPSCKRLIEVKEASLHRSEIP